MQINTFPKISGISPLLFIAFSSLLIVMLIIRFLAIPLVVTIASNDKELTYFTSKVSSESGYADLRQDIQQKIDILDKKLSESTTVELPADISSYLEYLISLGRKEGIQFSRMQPQKAVFEGQFTIYPLMLVFSTTYHDMGRFIATMEKLPHLYRIQRLAIDSGDHGVCEAKLLLLCRIPGDVAND